MVERGCTTQHFDKTLKQSNITNLKYTSYNGQGIL